MEKKTKKHDLMLVAVILAAAGLFFIGNYFINRKPAVMVEVTVDGKVVEELDITKNTELVIHGHNGGTNTLVIEDGRVYVSEASCPDKLCQNQGKISQSGEMIVCLPNLMIAKIVGGETEN